MADSESTQGKSTGRSSAAKAKDAPAAEAAGNGNGEHQAPPIPVSQLISDGSALLGHEPHVVAGALYGLDPAEELVIEDAKARVEDWLQQPVEVDPREGE